MNNQSAILGVVLAGGRSSRMGDRDKTLLPLGNATLVEAVVNRAAPQVSRLIISANRPSPTLDDLQLPIVPDQTPDRPGPLAGIVTALRWATHCGESYRWLASFSTDTPFFPADFVAQCLQEALNHDAQVVYASSAGRNHYTMAVWRADLLTYLQQQLLDGERALRRVLSGCRSQALPFPAASDAPNNDPFFNINTPEDWLQVQAIYPPA